MKQLTAATGLAGMLVLFAYPMPAQAQAVDVPELCRPVEIVKEVVRVVPSAVPGPVRKVPGPVRTIVQQVPGPVRTVEVPGPVTTVSVPGPRETIFVTRKVEVPVRVGQRPLPSATLTSQPTPSAAPSPEPRGDVEISTPEAAGFSAGFLGLGVLAGLLLPFLAAKWSRRRTQRQEVKNLSRLKNDLFSKE